MPSPAPARAHEWLGYYHDFPYFTAEAIRPGCQPRIMAHQGRVPKAIVLVHGLTDSPYFMAAIGEFFHSLGYNVYLPLLHCHGLAQPNGMEGVDVTQWKTNVDYAITAAAATADEVSIGGLSTGGTLSFHAAVVNPKVTGTVYLFSAALDLKVGRTGILNNVAEWLLRWRPLAKALDRRKPLIGDNPYRYSHMDMDGAHELAKLVAETDALLARFTPTRPFPKRVFAAHSEADASASIAGIERLQSVSDPARFMFFRIPAARKVAHASVVLREDVPATEPERKNPLFDDMMRAIAAFG
jgi:esterase/lipase